MGCCGSSEESNSIKKDKHQLENEPINNETNNLKSHNYSTASRNRIQPLEGDNLPVSDSKLLLYYGIS